MAEADIDALATAARQDGNMAPLWKAVYDLERWWFMPTGDRADPRPFCGVLDGKPYLMAFTTGDRARDFAIAQGRGDDDGGASAIAMPPKGVVEMAPSYEEQGVFGIVFDHHVSGFFAPLANLDPMWRHFRRA